MQPELSYCNGAEATQAKQGRHVVCVWLVVPGSSREDGMLEGELLYFRVGRFPGFWARGTPVFGPGAATMRIMEQRSAMPRDVLRRTAGLLRSIHKLPLGDPSYRLS